MTNLRDGARLLVKSLDVPREGRNFCGKKTNSEYISNETNSRTNDLLRVSRSSCGGLAPIMRRFFKASSSTTTYSLFFFSPPAFREVGCQKNWYFIVPITLLPLFVKFVSVSVDPSFGKHEVFFTQTLRFPPGAASDAETFPALGSSSLPFSVLVFRKRKGKNSLLRIRSESCEIMTWSGSDYCDGIFENRRIGFWQVSYNTYIY